MGSIGHFVFSLIKSALRIGFCILSMYFHDYFALAFGLLCAEVVGVLEELVDKR